ncbi:MAG TPA: NAD-dependent epimerase/dehydratase family protein [Thermoanaerobaculia bacterium]
MKRVLVTGASGFIGRHVTKALTDRGVEVRPFDRSHGGNILDADAVRRAVEGCDTVIHLAAKVHDLAARADDPEQERITLEGTRIVVEAARGTRLIFLSTVAVYPNSDQPHDEESPTQPATAYGRAKLEAERLVLAAGGTVLRPAMVYGEGCKGNLPRLVRAVARPLFAIPGGPDNRRSLLHIDNLVQAIVLAAEREQARGRIYVVADERTYSTREMVELIAEAQGRRTPIVRIPRALLLLAARVGDAGAKVVRRRLPFDSAALEKLTGSHSVNSARIVRELGYRPTRNFANAISDLLERDAPR